MEGKKTRNQSLYEYFNSLQLEYVQAELRRKIYTLEKDKIFQGRLLDRKKRKIEDIAKRNSFHSIFDSHEEYLKYYSSLCDGENYPNFIYADEEQRTEFELRDFHNYYSPGTEVKVIEAEVAIGTIMRPPENGLILVQVMGEGEPRLIKGELIVRVL